MIKKIDQTIYNSGAYNSTGIYNGRGVYKDNASSFDKDLLTLFYGNLDNGKTCNYSTLPYTHVSTLSTVKISGCPLGYEVPCINATSQNIYAFVEQNIDKSSFNNVTIENFVYGSNPQFRLSSLYTYGSYNCSVWYENSRVYFEVNNNTTSYNINVAGNWSHVALEFTDTKVRFFLNGNLIDERTFSSNSLVARYGVINGGWFKNYFFCQFALWKKLLSNGGSSFTPPSSPYINF